jgi:hypothetical protein
MKRSTFFLLLLFSTTNSFAQPAGYVPGTQECWTFNGRPHGYFAAEGNGERHYLLSFTGNGENNCSDYQTQAPQKWLRDDITNWDGKTVRASTDTVAWTVLTILNTNDQSHNTYATDIAFFMTNSGIPAAHFNEPWRWHIEGISGGVMRMWGFMLNISGHNSPYRNLFSTIICQSGPNLNATWLTQAKPYSATRRSWVWCGTADGGQTPPSASQRLYDSLSGTKYLTLQAGTGHSNATWDSCLSLKGTDTTTNRWLWMVRYPGYTPPVPPTNPSDPYPGGPAGYVPGTQVCWTFNGRPHGYFRAAGNGERHILISWTDRADSNCADYQTNAPQKFLSDAGTNWNGRTVRAPGDTIVWEILTMVNTNNYSLGTYAGDINYFFQNIYQTDTSDHSTFHIQGIGFGVNRFWGYITNHQNHNSPYRGIFSTTLSMGGEHITASLWPLLKAYSPGRRHWVWHGTADAVNSTSASTKLYDSLGGFKRLTLQSGGTHSHDTWDSCLRLGGNDSLSNRWIWMVSGGSTALMSRTTRLLDVPIPASENKTLLFPNPANANVTINFGRLPADKYSITITDQMGRIQRVINNVRDLQYRLDVSTLRKGIYIIHINGATQRITQKLVKE